MNHNIVVIGDDKYMAVRQRGLSCGGCVAEDGKGKSYLCRALPTCVAFHRPDDTSVIFKPYHGKRT